MRQFTLTIATENDAFQGRDAEATEVARILRQAAYNVSAFDQEFPLLDENGNTVGRAAFVEVPE